MTSDLGLDWLTSTDLVGFGLCLLLTVLAMKMKSFPFVVVSAVAWLAMGLQVALTSESLMIMLLIFSIAAAEVMWGSKYKGW